MSWSPTSSNPVRDRSCDALVGQLPSGAGTAVPLVKPTLRGILPHGSEGPWVPIPLRSTGPDDSPCCSTTAVGFVEDKSPFPPENAVCDPSTSTLQPIRHCANADCTKLLDSARSIYCSPACKQRCYRARHASSRLAKVGKLPPTRVRTDRVAHSVYECSTCSERFVGLRRCPDCHLFMRNVGVGGVCLHCDEPLLLTELLGDGGATLLD
jgi:hypothetical protein